jgi:FkbM family methyltransferase
VGYFSLWLAELRRKQCLSHDFSALCIDADSRAQEKIGQLIRMNRFQDKIFFKQGAISLSKTTVPFVEAHHMPNSSVAGNGVDKAKTKEVEVITAQRIYDIFPPPYDLIKLDIEGSEYDFFAGYDLVLRSSKFLVFEGHISTQAADRLDKCKELLKDKNFELIEEYKSFCGIQNILLYKNNKPIAKIS